MEAPTQTTSSVNDEKMSIDTLVSRSTPPLHSDSDSTSSNDSAERVNTSPMSPLLTDVEKEQTSYTTLVTEEELTAIHRSSSTSPISEVSEIPVEVIELKSTSSSRSTSPISVVSEVSEIPEVPEVKSTHSSGSTSPTVDVNQFHSTSSPRTPTLPLVNQEDKVFEYTSSDSTLMNEQKEQKEQNSAVNNDMHSWLNWALLTCPPTMKYAGLLLLAGGLFAMSFGAVGAGAAAVGVGALLATFGHYSTKNIQKTTPSSDVDTEMYACPPGVAVSPL